MFRNWELKTISTPWRHEPCPVFSRLRNHHLTSEWFTWVPKSLAGKTMLPMWILFFHQNWEICYYPLKMIFNVYLFWLFAFWTLIWSFIAPRHPLHISRCQCFTEFDSTWLCFLIRWCPILTHHLGEQGWPGVLRIYFAFYWQGQSRVTVSNSFCSLHLVLFISLGNAFHLFLFTNLKCFCLVWVLGWIGSCLKYTYVTVWYLSFSSLHYWPCFQGAPLLSWKRIFKKYRFIQ